MGKIRTVWRNFFDIRQGEYSRTLFMSLYLLFVLFAYYILKPVSRSLFLNKFNIDDLPYLYILIAMGGGLLAYLYSRLAVKASLAVAVFWAMALAVICLVVMWWLIGLKLPWMLYVLNVWVSLFSVVLVSQGWLVAANVFNPREAKRLYGLLGLGAVLGAAFGGEFTRRVVKWVGTTNLLLASAAMVILAYVAFRLAVAQKGVSLAGARAVESEEAEFSLRDIATSIRRNRHLQVIIAIMAITFIVDVMVEYQFQAMAAQKYRGDRLTAFFGSFYGLYLNLVTFTFQFFLTALVVGRWGVGGTLQIMPVSIAIASAGSIVAPGVLSASAVRLTEAATRYTLNRTGMELLYLPLPVELKNRTKAFVDIFVDRLSRGLGGILLAIYAAILVTNTKHVDLRPLSMMVIGFTLVWALLSSRASKEYVATLRKRLASRRLDLETARITLPDPATLRLLEETGSSANPRQATYALSLLGEVPGYDLTPVLQQLADSPLDQVRGKIYELARAAGISSLVDKALQEVRSSREGSGALKPAVAYLLRASSETTELARELRNHSNHLVVEGVLEAVASQREWARDVIDYQWLSEAVFDPSPERRALAAFAIGITGDEGTEALHHLLRDPDPEVVAAACRAAGILQNRAYLPAILSLLANARLRGTAIASLSSYGTRIIGTLDDVIRDEKFAPAIRRQIPRVLKLIPHQRSVNALLTVIREPDLAMRTAVLKALNSLRESNPDLDFSSTVVTEQILEEAREYFQMAAVLAPFRDQKNPGSAAALLARTIEERLKLTLERLFRLMGLRYPPKEIYLAYLAINRRRSEEYAAATEFLDNVLDQELKRILLPLLDAPDSVLQRGRELFAESVRDAESAIRGLIGSGDPWLVACAIAAASELRLRRLEPVIADAARRSGAEVALVARSAQAGLA